MAAVVVALGSNIGDRRKHLTDAKTFLATLSATALQASSIYISEAMGPSTRDFYNAVVKITTGEKPKLLLKKFKHFEREHGRPAHQPKWSARTIDLDIVAYGDLVIQTDPLIIPHPHYHKRLFVLKPLAEIRPHWKDVKTGASIEQLISTARDLKVIKTNLRW